MYLVVTTVEVEPDSIDRLVALFDSTNRDLVSAHDDWLAAYFTVNRSTSVVTVIAHWRQAASYEVLRTSAEFQSTTCGEYPVSWASGRLSPSLRRFCRWCCWVASWSWPLVFGVVIDVAVIGVAVLQPDWTERLHG